MPFSDDELTLLEAIHADPKYDEPRMDYADWLESHGDSSPASMIRLQLSGDGDYTGEWLREYGRRWASPKPKELTNLFYRRGLPEAHLQADRAPPDLQKMSPRLRISLDVQDSADLAARLSSDIAIRVAVLAVYWDFKGARPPLSAAMMRQLADWPQLDRRASKSIIRHPRKQSGYSKRRSPRACRYWRRKP